MNCANHPHNDHPTCRTCADARGRGTYTIVVEGYDEERNWTLYDPAGNKVDFEVVSEWDWNKRNEVSR
jgi:hypothetical protein